ncbi:glucokinase [Halioxenophilus aromaticivorans]|uniref:Glucokinase n=1 Tax=Halioxenophilus aromaticivorans TaxID=1306992 RepID=A0AAV3UBN1_9ALTE
MQSPRIIADIGGTNARFAYAASEGSIEQEKVLKTVDFETFEAALADYLGHLPSDINTPEEICLAVAGPIHDGVVKMTNTHWVIDQHTLLSGTFHNNRFSKAAVINDFEAIAISLPHLNDEQKASLGGGQEDHNCPMTVLGPGTGLGAALCTPFNGHWVPFATEGGHVSLGPVTAREFKLFQFWRDKGLDTAREYYLSGPGLERIYQAVSVELTGSATTLNAAEISQLAAEGDSTALAAIDCFCALLGSAAGDQALATGARGGVFIAGGISLKLIDFLRRSSFRKRFESKSSMQPYLAKIPTYVITEPNPGLIGSSYACIDTQMKG